PRPSIKLPPVETLVIGSALTVAREDGGFAVTREGRHLPRPHIAAITHRETDFVAVAERFFGTPYLWGGKSSFGVHDLCLPHEPDKAMSAGCPMRRWVSRVARRHHETYRTSVERVAGPGCRRPQPAAAAARPSAGALPLARQPVQPHRFQ